MRKRRGLGRVERQRGPFRSLDGELLERRCLPVSVVLTPVQDNTLFEDASGGIANGAGEYLFAGRTAQPSGRAIRRSLVGFDIAAQIPAGATIQSATLSMTMSKTTSGPQDIGLHRVLADWGEGTSDAAGEEGRGTEAAEGDATWKYRLYDTVEWQTPGGDFEPTASATTSVDNVGDYVWSTPELAEDVQYWLDHPDEDFGWLLHGQEDTSFAAKQFGSRENADSAQRPQLTIEYALAEATSWQNTNLAEDVSGDGFVSPIDALLILNVLNGVGNGLEEGPLPDPPTAPLLPPPFVDVNGDQNVTGSDALLVLNFLNAQSIVPDDGEA